MTDRAVEGSHRRSTVNDTASKNPLGHCQQSQIREEEFIER